MKKRKGLLMYLGRSISGGHSVQFDYTEISEQNEMGRVWTFGKKVFSKGSIGSVYKVEFDGSTINYQRTQMPTSILKELDGDRFIGTSILFPILERLNEEDRQIEITVRNSKKDISPMGDEIKNIKQLYLDLRPHQRMAFIGNLIYKITK